MPAAGRAIASLMILHRLHKTPPLAPPRKRGGGLDFRLNFVFRVGNSLRVRSFTEVISGSTSRRGRENSSPLSNSAQIVIFYT